MTTRRPPTRRRPGRPGSTSRTRTRRKGGVLAALKQLWAALFNRNAPAAGGDGSAPPQAQQPRRRSRWDDEELDRDERGRWEPGEHDDEQDQQTAEPH
ncbi:MAG TPA: hypothetical protein VHH34_11605 [Pseudonocardiaceae bacterium]|nr:hypothetical protein [Pseudonocardiaceae bacterium]